MDYLPKREADKRDWLNNLKTQIATAGPTLGLTAAEVTTVQNTCTTSIGLLDAHNAAQTAAKTAKVAKDTGVSANEKSLRIVFKKLKTHNAYTEALGQQLRIIGEDVSIDYSTYKPSIKATIMPGRVRIDFVKDGLDGVHIYARLKGQAMWTKLALDTYSPYEDTRPLAAIGTPEHREYMAIGVLYDEEVTLASDIIEAVFGG